MGGFGSGRYGWLPVIENGLKLDIRRMRKHGQFQHNVVRGSGTLTWSNTYTGEKVASIGFSYSTSASAPWCRLQYTVTRDGEPVDVDDWFQLEPFSQPYGGVRWYFICPATRKRAQCLYMPSGATHFRSRHGFNVKLQYASQRQDNIARSTNQMRKVSTRVLEEWPAGLRDKYADWDFPPKPPGMHWETYNRLEAKYDRLDAIGWLALGNKLEVLDKILS